MAGSQTFILLAINKPLRLLGGPARFIEIQLTADPLDHSELIIAVEYLELLGQAGLTPVCL